MYKMYNGGWGEVTVRRWDRTPNPFTPFILQDICSLRVKASPGCFSNSTGSQRQTETEIERILHYTRLFTQIFAQILEKKQLTECLKTAK